VSTDWKGKNCRNHPIVHGKIDGFLSISLVFLVSPSHLFSAERCRETSGTQASARGGRAGYPEGFCRWNDWVIGFGETIPICEPIYDYYLVGGFEHGFYFSIYWEYIIIIPTDELIL
jgi:hypothetical protein